MTTEDYKRAYQSIEAQLEKEKEAEELAGRDTSELDKKLEETQEAIENLEKRGDENAI